jgi:hypothetical protein
LPPPALDQPRKILVVLRQVRPPHLQHLLGPFAVLLRVIRNG